MKKIATCLLILSIAPLNAAANTLRTVALTDNVAPGTSGALFSIFSAPSLNSFGQVAFQGGIPPKDADTLFVYDRGIWSEGDDSGLTLMALAGNFAPGASDAVLSYVFSPILNDSGHTAFVGEFVGMQGAGFNTRGIWSEGGGSGLALVARSGSAASGALYSSVGAALLNNSGHTAFVGEFVGTQGAGFSTRGIWSEGGGSGLALVADELNVAPGTLGAFFSNVEGPVLNDSGHTAFSGSIFGTGVSSRNDHGIWSEGGGSGLALVARTGDVAPDTSGALFSTLSGRPVLNNAGHTAFSGFLNGTGNVRSNDQGIWSEGGGSGLALVARTGDVAPDTSGALFSGFSEFPVLNGAGQTAFWGRLTGAEVTNSNAWGIWSEGGGSGLALVARTGDVAPGASGAVFSELFTIPVLNGAGQTAFSGLLSGAGVTGSNAWGIWAEDTNGVLQLIAREGDLLDVDDGAGVDLRTIASLSFSSGSGNEDGRSSGFNDLGQLAFMATFTDGSSGVFVSNLVAVPEPTTFALLGLGALRIVARRRRCGCGTLC